jgi:queuine/archaeosine tRNA-ribosyltransferase
MSNKELHSIRQAVKEKELSRVRNQWFKEYEKMKNVSKVCQMFGINRSAE